MTVIANSTTALRHQIRLVHSATEQEISPVRLGPVGWPTGWAARVIGGTVVVTSTTATPGPDHIDVVIADGALARLLDLPSPVPGQPINSVRVPLTTAAIDVPVSPLPSVLTVELAKDGTTGLSNGKTVTLSGAGGSPVIPLPETAMPGVYESASTVWPASLNPADLQVGGTFARKVFIDFTRASTRITVVDPT